MIARCKHCGRRVQVTARHEYGGSIGARRAYYRHKDLDGQSCVGSQTLVPDDVVVAGSERAQAAPESELDEELDEAHRTPEER